MRTWVFENDMIYDFETLEVDDEFIPEPCEDNTSRTEHYFIDKISLPRSASRAIARAAHLPSAQS